jgi:hypothetical protein
MSFLSYWTFRRFYAQCKSVKSHFLICLLVGLAVHASASEGSFWGFERERSRYDGQIWKADLEAKDYAAVTASLLNQFEEITGKRLSPGEKGKAAIKVYTNSGSGLQTPVKLTRAVIAYLLAKGFSRSDLIIIDAREAFLRDAGYLPPVSRLATLGPRFEGVPVIALDADSPTHPTWYYDSPIPREFTTPLGREILQTPLELDPVEARKSYLPAPLILDVDFWINLPIPAHHPAFAFSGALANATLWNVTNGARFLNSPANAPVAMAEIAAIPELRDTWALNLQSMEKAQYIAGPQFNAQYTTGLSEIWMSVDPVAMDQASLGVLNKAREEAGFSPFPLVPEFLRYSLQLGLGRFAGMEQPPESPLSPRP